MNHLVPSRTPLPRKYTNREELSYRSFPFLPLEGIDRVFSVFFVHAVVTQPYQPEILTEYVIRGNSAILKCSIPSYIAEFVTVEAWIREDGEVYIPEDPAVGQQGIGVWQGLGLVRTPPRRISSSSSFKSFPFEGEKRDEFIYLYIVRVWTIISIQMGKG